MDAQQALADLTEISSQIEAAAIVEGTGAVVASTLGDAARTAALGELAGKLLEAAAAAGQAGELAQLEAAADEGSVFVVREGGRAAIAVTRPNPTVGLVFYDLKSALRSAAAAGGDGA